MLPPVNWNLMSPYRRFCEFVHNMPVAVVNDAAERNVKLIQDFVSGSHDEALRQDLLLAVEVKRKGGSVKGSTKKKKS